MKKPLRVLLVEDNPDDAHLIVDELAQAGYEVTFERVETAAALSKALREPAWNLVLADYALPNFSAAAALLLVKQVGYELPFIIVSGTITDQTAVTAMKAGAHDFVTKDHLARLGPAVQRELAEAALRADCTRLAEKLHREHDCFRTIVENLPDAILLIGMDDRIAYASPALQRVAGHVPATWVGQSVLEFVHPDSSAEFAGDLARARGHTGTTVRATCRLRHHDRSWCCFDVTCTSLLHEPAVQAVLVTLRDGSVPAGHGSVGATSSHQGLPA